MADGGRQKPTHWVMRKHQSPHPQETQRNEPGRKMSRITPQHEAGMQEREPPRARHWASRLPCPCCLYSPVMLASGKVPKTALGGHCLLLYARALANRFSLPLQGSEPSLLPRSQPARKSSPFIKGRAGGTPTEAPRSWETAEKTKLEGRAVSGFQGRSGRFRVSHQAD